MYLSHFGLQRFPFSIAPDPSLLFPSHGHQEALAHLQYALTGHGGLVCLTGEVGTGKTTLCRAFLEQTPANIRTAYIFNPRLSPLELLQALCDELEISWSEDEQQQALYKKLNQTLLEIYGRGERVICLVDEAQAMPAPTLEQVRLLTNLETSDHKLLTLMLVGQPELRDMLNQHELRQLNQRITARYHLNTLDQADALPYLTFRLKNAGADQAESVFEPQAAALMWQRCKGIPRLMNSVADRCLLGAFAADVNEVSVAIAERAADEVLGSEPAAKSTVSISATAVPASQFAEASSDNRQIRNLTRAVWALVVCFVFFGGLVVFGAPSPTNSMDALRSTVASWIAPENDNTGLTSAISLTNAIVADGGKSDSKPPVESGLSERQSGPVPDLEPELMADFDQKTTSNTGAIKETAESLISRQLASNMGLGELNCDELAQFGWQCLWVSWPLSQLEPLKQQVAVNLSGQWKLLNGDIPRLPGEYSALVIWQPVSGYERAVQPGQSSAVVDWVRRALGVVWHGDWQMVGPDGNGEASLDRNLYDPLLQIEVAKFQVANGLDADRIIGPQTLIYLQRKLYLEQDTAAAEGQN